ncbi:MAG: TonB-dependent receptor [Flavobacteriaceae bacterium]|nr:TonB-dependent receptor [Flavobacteriaceae bacterium]
MRNFIVTVVMLLHTVFSFSQECDYTLSGTIIDTNDNSPLSGATVIVAGLERAVISNFEGNFKIEGLCEGTYNLQISHPECSTQAYSVALKESLTKTFKLEHHLESLNEVIISGKAFTTKTESLLENNLNEEALEGFSGNTLGDALKQLSGVSSLNTGNAIAKPMINGLHSSRISIINNGVRMQDQEWGAEHSPNVDVNSASRVTVIKGASALQYTGDAIGGIIISEAAKIPIKDTLYGKSIFTFSSNGRGGSNTTSLLKGFEGGWFAQVQGTVKRYGDFETPDYILSNTGNFEGDVLARFGQNKIDWGWEAQYSLFKNDIGILRASHLGGAEDLVNAINSPEPLIINPFTYDIDRPRQEVTHQIAKVSAFKKLEGIGKLEVAYDFQSNQRFEYDIRRGDDADKPSVDLRLNTHNLNVGLEISEGAWDFKTGASFNYQDNFADPATGVRRLIPDYEQYKIGSYGIANWKLHPDISLEGGVRFDHTYMDVFKFYRTSFWELREYDQLFPSIVVEDYGNQILTNPQLSFNNLSATLGAAYAISTHWNVLTNISLATRAPNASELFSEGLHHGASRIELGDLRFTSESSKKIVLTLQKKGKLNFSVNPFFNLLDDFIIIEPTGVEQTIRGNFQVWEYRQTAAKMMGVDFNLSTPIIENLQYAHTFSLVKGYERNNNNPLINMPPVSFTNEFTYQKTHWNFSLRQAYFFEQNEFPNTNFEVFIPETQTSEIIDVSTPPGAYQLWSLSANYQFNVFNKSKLSVGLQVQNLFDTAYRNYLNRLRYYADDLGRNIIINTKINF